MLKGKNAVITGTLQGIGKATLEYFVSNGANVWACAQRQDDAFEAYCKELEAKFVEEGKQRGLGGLKGHRSVGGIRASIYNAMPLAGCEALAQFMEDFYQNNKA